MISKMDFVTVVIGLMVLIAIVSFVKMVAKSALSVGSSQEQKMIAKSFGSEKPGERRAMHINYTSHGRYVVAIIKCTKIFGNRLGYLSMENNSSWAIRDFIGGVMLRSGASRRTLADIEAVVDEFYPHPPYRAVGRKHEWVSDLESRSRAIFGKTYDAHTPPDSSWGGWKPLP